MLPETRDLLVDYDDKTEFFKSEIARCKAVIKNLNKFGEKALNEYDLKRGVTVSQAMAIMDENILYFEQKKKEREKEVKDAKENSKNNIN